MSAHAHGDDGHDFAHPMPVPILLAVFFALLFLTFVTVFQTNFHFGRWEVPIVMAIATIKAALVVFFFMHLGFDKPFNVIVFLGSFVFVGLFVIFTLSDSQMTSGSFEPILDDVVPAMVEEPLAGAEAEGAAP